MDPRFSFGGDEHLFIEFDEAMSLDAFFKALSLVTALREAAITGVTEICPANASALIRFDPEVIVVRLDLATPLRNPALPKGDRWVFDDLRPKFFDKTQRLRIARAKFVFIARQFGQMLKFFVFEIKLGMAK